MIKREAVKYHLSENGLIHGYKWFDDSITKYKGIIIIVHGMAEHIERYDEFGKLLALNNFLVFGHNQRGHKDTSSKEDYGYMSDNDCLMILVNDVYEIRNQVHEQYPDLPIIVFGHSMGSFVSQRFIELHGEEINGCILCGSARQPSMLIGAGHMIASLIVTFKGRKYRSKILDNLSFGNYNNAFKPNRTTCDWLNRDEVEVDKYIADEYCGGIFTAAYFKDFTALIKKANKNQHLIPKTLPILLIAGDHDPVGGMGKYVNKLYQCYKEKQKIDNVQMKLYPGARHELLLETCKEEAMNDCVNWLNSIL